MKHQLLTTSTIWLALLSGLVAGCLDSNGGNGEPDAAPDASPESISVGFPDGGCEPRSHKRCGEDGNVYWHNSCDEREALDRECTAGRAECVEIGDSASTNAECHCLNHWGGDDCTSCPSNWDATMDCNVCAAHWRGELCNRCPGHFDPTQNCNACRGNWQGGDCTVCKQGYDPEQSCDICLNHWQGDDCEICPEHFSEESACATCEPGWAGSDCDVCVRYVNIDASAEVASRDGLTWATAFDNIQAALDAAHQAAEGLPVAPEEMPEDTDAPEIDAGLELEADAGGDAGRDPDSDWEVESSAPDMLQSGACQVWVVRGVYALRPPDDNDEETRTNTFTLRPNVQLLGGFVGEETKSEARDPRENPTVLNGNGAYHVVTGSDDAWIDGFVIANGRADGEAQWGMGGGMFNQGASPMVRKCSFVGNVAEAGGAMYNDVDTTVEDCLFEANGAIRGGAVFSDARSAVDILASVFAGNWAEESGGALFNEGESTTYVENAVFVDNAAAGGGAVYNQLAATVTESSTFYLNSATGEGYAIYNNGGASSIVNSILWGAGPAELGYSPGTESLITYSDYDFDQNTGNISADPLYEGELAVGALTGIGYDPARHVSRLVDDSAKWSPGELAGSFVRLAQDQESGESSWHYILSNDETSLTIFGDAADWFAVSSSYLVYSLVPSYDSPCRDAGEALTAPGEDIRGNERKDAPDLGAYEN